MKTKPMFGDKYLPKAATPRFSGSRIPPYKGTITDPTACHYFSMVCGISCSDAFCNEPLSAEALLKIILSLYKIDAVEEGKRYNIWEKLGYKWEPVSDVTMPL